MIPPSWTAYRRVEDSELVGYLVVDASGTTPLTLFGHPLAAPTSPAAAEAVLEQRGLASLAESWWLADGDQQTEVRILEAYPDRVRVVEAPYGFYGPDSPRHTLAAPTEALSPARRR